MDYKDLNCATVYGQGWDKFKGQSVVVGIDEAGRGPVLGPMVYGIGVCVAGEEADNQLKDLGVDDSKALTEVLREGIFKKLEEFEEFSFALRLIPAAHISRCMLRRCKFSLNDISHEAAIDLIRECLQVDMDVQQVMVDTVGPPESYQRKLEEEFPGMQITVAKKADSQFPVVGAASICAKVTRDHLLADWTFREPGFQAPENGWGSGYPGDPITKEFLEISLDKVFGFPSLVRFSWSTARELLEKKAVVVKWDDSDDKKGSKSLLSFFGKTTDATTTVQRHNFFIDRNLHSATSF